MKVDQLFELDRSAVKKKTKKPMGLSKIHNKHAKRQQNKASRKCKIDDELDAKE